ncbi:MAG TPA: GIY-YIG nuclease family protein [Pyrinomonadaceae bacterium]|jgi:excinuclease UvrABC nuclease subunit|nr:GIY-YIG nuclease family protein [Pyrinomonadaceae bacterium]
MKVNELNPFPPTKVQFALKSKKLVPNTPGCYALVTFDCSVLYVGLATSLANRFVQHCESKEKCEPTQDGKAFWFYFLEAEPKELNRIERTWQQQYFAVNGRLPILNKVDSPMIGG